MGGLLAELALFLVGAELAVLVEEAEAGEGPEKEAQEEPCWRPLLELLDGAF